jgi:hypothetical protein
MSAARKPELSERQRVQVERARALEATGAAALSAGYRHVNPDDPGQVYGYAFGAARATVRELLAIVDELTGGAPVKAGPEGNTPQ